MVSRSKRESDQISTLIESLTTYGLTAEEIAQVTGATPTEGITVLYQEKRTNATVIHRRLERIHEIAFLLSEGLQKTEVGKWFRAPNRILQEYSPLQMIALGGYDQALAAAAAYAEGADL